MTVMRHLIFLALSSLMVLTIVQAAAAGQHKKAVASIQLLAIKQPSVGIHVLDATTPTFVTNFTSTSAEADPDWSVDWNLPPREQVIHVCVSVNGPLASLGGTDLAADIEAQADGDDSFHPLSGTGCGQINALDLPEIHVSRANHKEGSRTFRLLLRVDPRKYHRSTGDLSGTLNIVGDLSDGPEALQ